MVLQLRRKLCKRKQLLKLFAINSLIYIMIFIDGLVLDSIILGVLLHPNRQSKSNTDSTIFVFCFLLNLYLFYCFLHSYRIVRTFFLRIKSEGYISNETVEQLHCESCDRFLADRFVEGTCPRCKYEDARGDQCDGCGHLVNAVELINPRCKMCNIRPVIKNSVQFFLDLPKVSL